MNKLMITLGGSYVCWPGPGYDEWTYGGLTYQSMKEIDDLIAKLYYSLGYRKVVVLTTPGYGARVSAEHIADSYLGIGGTIDYRRVHVVNDTQALLTLIIHKEMTNAIFVVYSNEVAKFIACQVADAMGIKLSHCLGAETMKTGEVYIIDFEKRTDSFISR